MCVGRRRRGKGTTGTETQGAGRLSAAETGKLDAAELRRNREDTGDTVKAGTVIRPRRQRTKRGKKGRRRR